MADIKGNLKMLRQELGADVTLVAVSKTKPNEDIMEAYELGQRDFGENRVQEMVDKYEALPKDIKWHMIGHVQSNKIKYFAPFVDLVHGMDKPKRFKELNKEAAKNNRVIRCLLQVHIAKEESKFGFDYKEAEDFLSKDLQKLYPFVQVCGLMGMATNTSNETVVNNEFADLYSFYSKVKETYQLNTFEILSMGMSGDYPLAIGNGSNMVRIGSAIFGSR